MSPVRRGIKSDASAIAQRVADQLFRDHQIESLVSPEFSRQDFEFALANSATPVWVDDSNGHFRGHLYGATLDDALHNSQTWTGPDGYSYESDDVLDNLCEWAYHSWREQGSTAHLVWALAGGGTQAWIERGYQITSVRGALALPQPWDVTWPDEHVIRRASVSDLPAALAFDALIDLAQGTPVDLQTGAQREENEADLFELLDDPDCHYYLLYVDELPAAQCVAFALPALRGNYDDTIYVSSLAVASAFRRRGLATRLVRTVLNDSFDDGFRFAEVRWHIDNDAATALWSSLDFRPTYVQLHRSLLN